MQPTQPTQPTQDDKAIQEDLDRAQADLQDKVGQLKTVVAHVPAAAQQKVSAAAVDSFTSAAS